MLPPTIAPQQRQGHTIAPSGSSELKMHVLPLEKFHSIPASILNAFRVTFKVNFLKTVPLLRQLKSTELEHIANLCNYGKYLAGDYLNSGGVCSQILFVEDGQIKATKKLRDSGQVVVHYYGAGSVIAPVSGCLV